MKKIFVPVDAAAQLALEYDTATLAQLKSIEMDDDLYFLLEESGFFNELNAFFSVNIDNNEDEEILNIEKMRLFLTYYNFDRQNKTLKKFLEKFKDAMLFAINQNTGVYFYF